MIYLERVCSNHEAHSGVNLPSEQANNCHYPFDEDWNSSRYKGEYTVRIPWQRSEQASR